MKNVVELLNNDKYGGISMNVINKEELKTTFVQMIKDYRWMVKEEQRLSKLNYIANGSFNTKMVAQYGLEAAMPHANTSIKSQTEIKLASKREERNFKRLIRLRNELLILDYVNELLENDLQETVYDWLLEGESLRGIASFIETSKDTVIEVRDRIIELAINDEKIETFLLYGELDSFEDKTDKSDKKDKTA